MATEPVRKFVHLVEHVILLIVMLATLVAVVQEIWQIIERQEVRLSDLLLMFLYLEVIAMVGIYYEEHKLPVRYPIYIAIVALARYIILESKSLDSTSMLGIGGTILLLTISVFIVRYGHVKYPWKGVDE
ncbi:MAG: phosphate-starvation-inducible E [Gammaproteobacteria bacterium]|nr:MAG: phosphate-starvation-inducible E [Gammaproteobacteria bacterium]